MTTKTVRKRTRRKSAEATIQVDTTATKDGEEKVVTDKRHSKPVAIEGEAAYVGVTGGMTVNTGNFNSAKLAVHVSLPFTHTGDESVRATYEVASALVDEFIAKEHAKAVGAPAEPSSA